MRALCRCGYAHNLADIARQNVRVISNAGGVNPQACANAVRALVDEMGLDLTVAVVLGDDLTHRPRHRDDLYRSDRSHPVHACVPGTGRRGYHSRVYVRNPRRADGRDDLYHGADVLVWLLPRLSGDHFHSGPRTVSGSDHNGCRSGMAGCDDCAEPANILSDPAIRLCAVLSTRGGTA